jgi:predicted phage terminase large subunit-like protein
MTIQTYSGLDALPSSLRIYGASDWATMEPEPGKKEPDFSEHGVWGLDAIGDLWAIDWWSGQVETDKSIAAFQKFVNIYRPTRWFGEGGLIDKAIGPAIRHSMRLSQKFVLIEQLTSISDKSVKLQAFHARMAAKTVHFPIRRAWADQVIDQLIKFPGGRWDDKADVCGLIGRGVDKMHEANIPLPNRRPLLVPFSEEWLMFSEHMGKPRVRYF